VLESKKAQKAHARQRGPGASIGQVEGMVWGAFVSTQKNHKMHTGWRRPIGCLKSQVIFRKRATTYRALLQKMTCKDKVLDGSSPPCRMHTIDKRLLMHHRVDASSPPYDNLHCINRMPAPRSWRV